MYILVPGSPNELCSGNLINIGIGDDSNILAITYHGKPAYYAWGNGDQLIGPNIRFTIDSIVNYEYVQLLTVTQVDGNGYCPLCVPVKSRMWNPFFDMRDSLPITIGFSSISDSELDTLISYAQSSDWDTCMLGIQLALGGALASPNAALSVFHSLSKNNFWYRYDSDPRFTETVSIDFGPESQTKHLVL